jgi:hypothetical protein
MFPGIKLCVPGIHHAWIPGDRGYITNKDYNGRGGGFQGHNMIYVGAGNFIHAYGNGKGPLVDQLKYVRGYNHDIRSVPKGKISEMRNTWLENSRRFPKINP